MGYSKASKETRGKKRWRAYINVQGKQIVVYKETEDQARNWSIKMNMKFAKEKRMENGFELIMELLGKPLKKTTKYVIRNGCAIMLTDEGGRCPDYEGCPHAKDCLYFVVQEGYAGWNGRKV